MDFKEAPETLSLDFTHISNALKMRISSTFTVQEAPGSHRSKLRRDAENKIERA